MIRRSTRWLGTLLALLVTPAAWCAEFSLSKAEFVAGRGYERANENGLIFTFANASGWSWGDTFFFFDVGGLDDLGTHGGLHLEFAPRRRLWQSTADTSALARVYLIGQVDFDRNKVVTKSTPMAGLSADWRVPGFRFLKTHLQVRDDPKLAGSGWQFTVAWNARFGGGDRWSFEGFADYTGREGTAIAHLHTQPQLLYHPSPRMAVGLEYQFWNNRLGIRGLDERAAQALVRFSF